MKEEEQEIIPENAVYRKIQDKFTYLFSIHHTEVKHQILSWESINYKVPTPVACKSHWLFHLIYPYDEQKVYEQLYTHFYLLILAVVFYIPYLLFGIDGALGKHCQIISNFLLCKWRVTPLEDMTQWAEDGSLFVAPGIEIRSETRSCDVPVGLVDSLLMWWLTHTPNQISLEASIIYTKSILDTCLIVESTKRAVIEAVTNYTFEHAITERYRVYGRVPRNSNTVEFSRNFNFLPVVLLIIFSFTYLTGYLYNITVPTIEFPVFTPDELNSFAYYED